MKINKFNMILFITLTVIFTYIALEDLFISIVLISAAIGTKEPILILLVLPYLGSSIFLTFFIIIFMKKIIKINKKNKADKKVLDNGKKTYARILNCESTGNYVNNYIEYKLGVAVYDPDSKTYVIIEKIVDNSMINEYPVDSYFEVLYYDKNIYIQTMTREFDIPFEILNVINSESLKDEYIEYKNNKLDLEKDRKTEKIKEKVKEKIIVIKRNREKLGILLFLIFDVLFLSFSSYFVKTLELLIHFKENVPLSIIFPLLLVLNIFFMVKAILHNFKKCKINYWGLLYFITLVIMAFISFNIE